MTESVGLQRAEGIRCSDADRERASERLRTAASEGYLTMDELEERLTGVYAARYGHELDVLVLDLPRATASRGAGWLAVLAVIWTQLRMDVALLFGRNGSRRGRRRAVVTVLAVLVVLAVIGSVLGELDGFEPEGIDPDGAEPADVEGADVEGDD